MTRTVKVAVIGSGLAGLTAAHLVSQPCEGDVEFEVHVFEKVCGLYSWSRVFPERFYH